MKLQCADTVSRQSRHTERKSETETGTRDGEQILTFTFTKKETFTVKSQIAKGIGADSLHGLLRKGEAGINVSAFWKTVSGLHVRAAFLICLVFMGAIIAGALP